MLRILPFDGLLQMLNEEELKSLLLRKDLKPLAEIGGYAFPKSDRIKRRVYRVRMIYAFIQEDDMRFEY